MSTIGGIVIGVVVGGVVAIAYRSKSKKEIDKLRQEAENLRNELQHERTRKDTQNDNKPKKDYAPADIAFKDNLKTFTPLLKGVSKKEITNRTKWTEAIISVNNEELTDLWKASNKRPELWITYLQTFGLQMDWVDSFVAMEYHTELYDVDSNEKIEVGQKYKVISSCWLYTDDNNEKSVVCKGVVKKTNV
mgnify:CR=1 FL=1